MNFMCKQYAQARFGYNVQVSSTPEDNRYPCGGDVSEVTVALPFVTDIDLEMFENKQVLRIEYLAKVCLVDRIVEESSARVM